MRVTQIENLDPYYSSNPGDWPQLHLDTHPVERIEALLGESSVKRGLDLQFGSRNPKPGVTIRTPAWWPAVRHSVKVDATIGDARITGSQSVTGIHNYDPDVGLRIQTKNQQLARLAKFAFDIASGATSSLFVVVYEDGLEVPSNTAHTGVNSRGNLEHPAEAGVTFGDPYLPPPGKRPTNMPNPFLFSNILFVASKAPDVITAHNQAIGALAAATGNEQSVAEIGGLMAKGYGLEPSELEVVLSPWGKKDPRVTARFLLDVADKEPDLVLGQ